MDWYLWRLVTAEVARLPDLHRDWSLVDAERAHLALDIQDDVQILLTPKPPKER